MHPEPDTWQGGLQVFAIDLDAFHRTSAGQRLDVLDEAERRRAGRMATPQLRARFVAAHAATRVILADTIGIAASRIEFASGPHGKPSLASSLPSGLHFNLSHCQGRALLAIADTEVGVDLEGWITRDTARLAGDVLSEAELAPFRELKPEDQPRELARRWAAKEALLKACGVGLQLDPNRVTVDIGGGWHSLPLPADDSPWWLQRIGIPGPWCAFVASKRCVQATLVEYA